LLVALLACLIGAAVQDEDQLRHRGCLLSFCGGDVLRTLRGQPLPAMLLADAIERIRCPVRLMHARDDQIADIATSRGHAEARPDWQLIEFDAGGHAVHIRNAAAV
jgi:pimeloyl-ACP methyl ester carboxylesterase